MYLHRREHGVVGGRTRMLSAAELAIFESLPGLLVRSLASADIAANEFVNFQKKYKTTQPVLTFAVATCCLGGDSQQNHAFPA